MRVLITGAYGNLGAYMTLGFAENGHSVGAAGRNLNLDLFHAYPDTTTSYIQHIQLDCTNVEQVADVLKSGWDIIIHLASANDNFLPGYPEMALKANTWATRVMLSEIAKLEQKPHFIYFSTFHIYGKSVGEITEETLVAPVHDYATTHFFAEEFVRQFHRTHKIPFTIIRLTNSYGAPIDSNTSKWYLVLNDLARMAIQDKVIALKSNGQAQRDFVWMPDVVNAIHQLAQIEPTNAHFNLGMGQSCRLIDIAQAVQQAYREQFQIELPITINNQDISTHLETLYVNITKLKSIISFEPQNQFIKEAKRVFQLLSH